MTARFGNQRGVALLFVLMAIALMSMLGATYLLSEHLGSRSDAASRDSALALQAAEAGIEDMLTRLNYIDAQGILFDDCQVPLASGLFAQQAKVAGDCARYIWEFPDGFCVNPDAAAGGPVLTTTPCTRHEDCAGIGWMGCGSMTEVSIILVRDVGCALERALGDTNIPRAQWRTTCLRSCPPLRVECTGPDVYVP
jgi:hypothetical protein